MQSDDLAKLFSRYWSFFLKGTLSTIVLSIVGTLGGLFLGVFLAFGKKLETKDYPWYSKLWRWPVKAICNVYSVVIRGTPMMVQAMLFKYGCQALGLNWNNVLQGVDTWNGWLIAGLIVITFNTAAYMGEIVQSGLNGVDKGQTEGAMSLGMSPMQTLFSVTLPQALRNAIPTIGNEWIVNIKDSSVLNIIGVSELYYWGDKAGNNSYRVLAAFLIVAMIYLILTLVTTGILKLVEYKMDGRKLKFSFKNLFFHYHKKEAA